MKRSTVARMHALSTVVVAAGLWVLASPAAAQSCTATASGVAFGSYSPFASVPADSTGQVGVTCAAQAVAQTLVYTLSLSSGQSGAYASRSLKSGSASLSYQLYTNATRTSVWGDGTSGTSTVGGSLLLSLSLPVSATATVYARMPAGQTSATAGSYSDTIIVTVAY